MLFTLSRTIMVACLTTALVAAQKPRLLSTENAYAPIPSRDGRMIAVVGTGWGRNAPITGLGRSNLKSDLGLMSLEGEVLRKRIGDCFLQGWLTTSEGVICFRDYHYFVFGSNGKLLKKAKETGASSEYSHTERVAYLTNKREFVWVEHWDGLKATVLMRNGKQVAHLASHAGDLVIPSPDERYIAVVGNGTDLWIFDTRQSTWSRLGKVDIHPSDDWDYIKPSWDPWFPDSSRLVLVSGSELVIASPDGKDRVPIANVSAPAGLPVASPDGKYVAFATFTPRPKEVRSDLKFWGGTRLWIVPADGSQKAMPMTAPDPDTTYTLRWLSERSLVFDRIADEPFYSHARLWILDLNDHWR